MKRFVMGMIVATVAALAVICSPALALGSADRCCVQHLNFAAGPYLVRPGANAILLDYAHVPKPAVDGYMIRMAPNLHYALPNGRCCGAIPRVDVIHLHHGVWLSNGTAGAGEGNGQGAFYPFMAAGEEKTQYAFPTGFGYPVGGKDAWVFNYMIHNLWPSPAKVYVTYAIDFVPKSSPRARTITPVHPIWMDVESRHIYPVFDVHRYSGRHGVFTFPYMAQNAYPAPEPALNQFRVEHPGTLIATAGHVHPGGLYTQLDISRPGVRRRGGALPGLAPDSTRLFRSMAHYWDPRGPISWDMAMTATAPDWRPQVRAGDVLSVSASYETRRASWYESMGIMLVWEAWTRATGSTDPFSHKLDQTGHVTHGHLAENRHHGGTDWVGVNLTKLPSCDPRQVLIQNFNYNPGGFYSSGHNRCIPTITRGQSLSFLNQDAPPTAAGFLASDSPYGRAIFHTVTSCQNPCGLDTGISYPLAGGPGNYDSGQLGFGTPAIGSLTWSTPRTLRPGLYTYFCRIHPFMRGAFRVLATK